MRGTALRLRGAAVAGALLLAAGCCHPAADVIDPVVRELAAMPVDVAPAPSPAETPAEPTEPPGGRLGLPRALPGFSVPDVRIPPRALGNATEREQAIQKNFPDPPPVGAEPPLALSPDGRPFTLADLQRMAQTSSPTIRQAVARVESARGAAVQAGLSPNPKVGYEGDTMLTAAGPGYQGGYVEQTVKTAGKLQLAQAAAEMDVVSAELALRAARSDVITQVRTAYFNLLWAREDLRIDRAVSRLTEEMYRLQLDLLKAGQVAAYEVMQFRAQAIQARAQLAESRSRAAANWQQLATAVGVPDLPSSEVDGKLDGSVPRFEQAEVLARILEKHTDVLTAHAGQQKARYQLRLAEVTPLPDVDLRFMLQKDYTSSTFLLSPSVAVGVAVPVWDRNQGNIKQASADLARTGAEAQRVRLELRNRAATAFDRYRAGQQIVELYRGQVLPDLVRVYRGVYDRYQKEPEKVNFNDVSTAQQNLVNAANTYLSGLSTLWGGVVDIAALVQTDDLYATGKMDYLEPLPDLEALFGTACLAK